jgi:hypothetical protein
LRCLTRWWHGVNEDDETGDDRKTLTGIKICKKQSNIMANKEPVPDDIQDCILKCKSVYKCRICPRIICLTEETMRAHLNSKVRHCMFLFCCENEFYVYNSISNYLESNARKQYQLTRQLIYDISIQSNKLFCSFLFILSNVIVDVLGSLFSSCP